jgi:hypothetical protein
MAGEIPDKPDPQYWRGRAKKTCADADRATDQRAKRMIFCVADSYDRLAEQIEVRLREAEKPK